MATTDDKKKPLVTLDAANPAPDGVVDTGQTGAGWAGTQGTRGGEQQLQEDTPQLTEQQVDNIKRAPSGVSVKDINKVPGSGEVKLPASATKYGVLRGAPASVVLQNMIDAIPVETKEQRERREKRERINKTIAALGDGFSALANIYYATKGAPAAEGKTLSAGEHDRQEEARKERENNIDRRIRLLKEQRAELNNLEAQRWKDRQLEIMEKYREGQNKISRKRADDYMEYLTKKNQLEKKAKEDEAKRKDEKAKQEQKESDNRIANNNKRTSAYQSRVSNQNKNNDRNTSDMIKKRGGRQYNPANDPGMEKVVERDKKTGTTTTYYRPRSKPSKPAGKTGSGSAKSKFSIHK